MDKCCRDLAKTLDRHLSVRDKERVQQWLNVSVREIAREEHFDLPVLAQWGLAEILDRLHEVSGWLVTHARYSEALNLLVSAQIRVWTVQFWAHTYQAFAGVLDYAAHD